MTVFNSRIRIWLAKFLVVVIAYGYIYYQLIYKKNFFEQLSSYQFRSTDAGILLIVLALMFFNWALEAVKWKILVRPIEKVNFLKSLKGVFIGLTVSIFTPNRTGEYFGRIWVLSQKRIQGIFSTITGSIAQLSITLLAGIIAILTFDADKINAINILSENRTLIIVVAVILSVVLLILIFSLPRFPDFFKTARKLHLYLSFLKKYTYKDIGKALLMSALRYVVFLIQFYLLIQVFDIHLNIFTVFSALALVYLGMAIIPSFTFAEIGIRGSLAITIFSIFAVNQTGIFLSMTLLWIINIALPAFLGSFFLFKLKISPDVRK